MTLQLDALSECLDQSDITHALTCIPQTLKETYNETIRSLPVKDVERVRKILMWILYAERHLALHEIAWAVGLPFPEDVLNICPSTFITPVNRSLLVGSICYRSRVNQHTEDVKISNITCVQLAHASVHDYFSSERLQESGSGNEMLDSLDPSVCHQEITIRCMSQLLDLGTSRLREIWFRSSSQRHDPNDPAPLAIGYNGITSPLNDSKTPSVTSGSQCSVCSTKKSDHPPPGTSEASPSSCKSESRSINSATEALNTWLRYKTERSSSDSEVSDLGPYPSDSEASDFGPDKRHESSDEEADDSSLDDTSAVESAEHREGLDEFSGGSSSYNMSDDEADSLETRSDSSDKTRSKTRQAVIKEIFTSIPLSPYSLTRLSYHWEQYDPQICTNDTLRALFIEFWTQGNPSLAFV